MSSANTPNNRRVPTACPVCDGVLTTTRLSCAQCGTELVGVFGSCAFCALDEPEIELVKVFLASRGNLREVEKHLGVSYPTARARFTRLLVKLGLNGDESAHSREQILDQVAVGKLSAEEAAVLLAEVE
ncbi:MAG: DUF2089 domain-containing protein [Propionibacteriaceae bacterium]|jgi:hypothetical protein|nr:DUF2089 domain-containing protein [Propionibacteriaceae bacterium]